MFLKEEVDLRRADFFYNALVDVSVQSVHDLSVFMIHNKKKKTIMFHEYVFCISYKRA